MTVRASYIDIDDAVALEMFKELFLQRFIPTHIRAQKLPKFMQLDQEDMPILEYEAQFTRLSRFTETCYS